MSIYAQLSASFVRILQRRPPPYIIQPHGTMYNAQYTNASPVHHRA